MAHYSKFLAIGGAASPHRDEQEMGRRGGRNKSGKGKGRMPKIGSLYVRRCVGRSFKEFESMVNNCLLYSLYSCSSYHSLSTLVDSLLVLVVELISLKKPTTTLSTTYGHSVGTDLEQGMRPTCTVFDTLHTGHDALS